MFTRNTYSLYVESCSARYADGLSVTRSHVLTVSSHVVVLGTFYSVRNLRYSAGPNDRRRCLRRRTRVQRFAIMTALSRVGLRSGRIRGRQTGNAIQAHTRPLRDDEYQWRRD